MVQRPSFNTSIMLFRFVAQNGAIMLTLAPGFLVDFLARRRRSPPCEEEEYCEENARPSPSMASVLSSIIVDEEDEEDEETEETLALLAAPGAGVELEDAGAAGEDPVSSSVPLSPDEDPVSSS